jgi:AraC family transcriptional regulator, transcriptional activator of the genes for pyochelin and ferripyochelin receptors
LEVAVKDTLISEIIDKKVMKCEIGFRNLGAKKTVATMLCLNPITYPLRISPMLSEFLVSRDYGSRMKESVVELTYGCEVLEEGTNLSLTENKPFLGLYFNLENDFRYSFPGTSLPPGNFPKNHYTFMYLPQEFCKYDLKSGTTTSFRLNFDYDFLMRFIPQFPILEAFMANVDCKTPCMIGSKPLIATDPMLAEVMSIVTCTYTHDVRDSFFYTKVFNVLLLCLEQITIIAGSEKVFESKIRVVRNYILDHLHDHLSLELLAKQIDVDPRTLTRNFKKMYKTTVMEFILEERMKKAIALLRDSNITISHIALEIGYKYISNFTEAFTRKFGYPPSTVRKQQHTEGQ